MNINFDISQDIGKLDDRIEEFSDEVLERITNKVSDITLASYFPYFSSLEVVMMIFDKFRTAEPNDFIKYAQPISVSEAYPALDIIFSAKQDKRWHLSPNPWIHIPLNDEKIRFGLDIYTLIDDYCPNAPSVFPVELSTESEQKLEEFKKQFPEMSEDVLRDIFFYQDPIKVIAPNGIGKRIEIFPPNFVPEIMRNYNLE